MPHSKAVSVFAAAAVLQLASHPVMIDIISAMSWLRWVTLVDELTETSGHRQWQTEETLPSH